MISRAGRKGNKEDEKPGQPLHDTRYKRVVVCPVNFRVHYVLGQNNFMCYTSFK